MARPKCMEWVTHAGYSKGASGKVHAPFSATTSPSMSTRVTFKSSRLSKNTISAHLPGVMEPSSLSMRKQVAVLMVIIWMARTTSMPHSTALRRM